MTSTPCENFLEKIRGSWSGHGSTMFPTMKNAVEFKHTQKFDVPENTVMKFMKTKTETFHAKKGVGMHFDEGFMRCVGAASPNTATWVMAHNSGNTEALTGTINKDGSSAVFESASSSSSSSTSAANGFVAGLHGQPETIGTKREISVHPPHDRMSQLFWMATKKVPALTLHLESQLTKDE